MKRKALLFCSLALVTSLVSCGEDTTSSALSSSSTTESSSVSTSTVSENVITNEDLEKAQTTYIDENGETQDLNRDSLYRNSGNPHLNPLGNQHVLVVPFSFEKNASDSRDTVVADDAMLEKIKTTFTADQETMESLGGTISVSDFYTKSSYGKANFEATVLDTWVQYDGTAKEFESKYSSVGAGVGASIEITSWYKAEYNKPSHGALGEDAKEWSYFDSDKDGYIDLMWIVYAYPYTQGNTSFWWAYVTYTSNNANVTNPTVKTLGWASTLFMTERNNGYDSHTFIHETGHTFGLDDYYDYGNRWKPMGGIDYMDQNLGDHSAYSKFSLGWTSPLVLSEEDLTGGKEAEITLRPLTTTGDCLLLASPNYNNTAFDEYFMLELMAPIGIAKDDYLKGYQSQVGYSKPGIRMTHVDARVFGGGISHDSYYTDANLLGQKGTELRVGNTYGGRIGWNYDSDFWPKEDGTNKMPMPHFSIIESYVPEDNWTNSPTYSASNDSLFVSGNRFRSTSGDWCSTYMPSGTNLWNKAVTTTGWTNSNTKTYTIDEECDFSYNFRITSIEEDEEYGYIAKVVVSLAE